MGIFKKTAVEYKDAVEEAQEKVQEAFGSFTAAQDALIAANEVFVERVKENDAYIASLQSRNVTLLEQADHVNRVSNKLGELIA